MSGKRPLMWCCFATLLLVVLFVANLFLGSVSIPAAEVFRALSGASDADAGWAFIVLQSRLPQAVTALLCGASLAVAGLLLQTVFANPLADPSILGVNAGAGLGVAVAMLLFGGSVVTATFSLSGFLLVVFSAFLGAALVILVLLLCASVLKSNLMLLIAGILISYITAAAISLLNYVATAEGVRSYIMWGLGNFGGVSMAQLPAFVLVCVLALGVSMALIKPLNALLLGEHYAVNLGVNVQRTRVLLLVVTGVLSAVTTAFCGPISFLGLAVPHLARLFAGTANHRVLLPLTLVCGGVTALACNLICTLPSDGTLIPLNVVTPLWGVPVVLYILFRQRGDRTFL